MTQSNTEFGLATLGSKALFPNGIRTIEVMLLDRSHSMRNFGLAPRDAVNVHLAGLKEMSGAEATAVSLLSFSADLRCELPMTPLARVASFVGCEPDANTHLYEAVAATLDRLILFQTSGRRIQIVMPVITDGADTSPHDVQTRSLERVRQMAKVLEHVDIQVPVIGIGVDGKEIARAMGFLDDLSIRVEPTAQGVYDSMMHSTIVTGQTMSGRRR